MRETARKKKKAGWIIGGILAFLFEALAVLAVLAISDPKKDQAFHQGATQRAAVQALAQGTLTGQPVALSEEQLNDLLPSDLAAYLSTDSLTVKAVHVSLTEDSLLEVYLPVRLQGIDLAVTMQVNPVCEAGKIQLQIKSLRVGYLPVPADWVLNMAREKLPAKITVDGSTISIPAQVQLLQTQSGETALTLKVTQLTVSGADKVFYLKVEADMDGLKDYLSGILDNWLN